MNEFLAILLSFCLSYHGYYKQTLSLSGAIAAFFAGTSALVSGFEYSVALLTFYGSSSFLTKLGANKKKLVEEGFKKCGKRDAFQVICTGGLGTLLGMLVIVFPNMNSALLSTLRLCYVSQFCVVCGDTWASELGTAFGGQARLITTFRKVPSGTNGGVTLLGICASFLGGSFVALCTHLSINYNNSAPIFTTWYLAIFLGGLFGFFGSLIDSVLGATLQQSLYSVEAAKIVKSFVDPSVKVISGIDFLSNCQINLISSFILSGIVGGVQLAYFS